MTGSGTIYFADTGASEILRLDAAGRLVLVAGIRGEAGIPGGGRPAARASADGPNGLAFNRAGDLYVAGLNTKTLLMITAGGRTRLPAGLTGLYPRGPAGLVTSPGGVIAMNNQLVQRITSPGPAHPVRLLPHPSCGYQRLLAQRHRRSGQRRHYLDTDAGNGYSTATALVVIEPDGHVRALWRS